MLQGKHILIGVSGGIAAYKIPELIRLYIKAGAEVKVTTTKNALEFVTELTLQTLSRNSVYSDVFAPWNEHTTEHVSLPDWTDAMVIAPATANTLDKIAQGIGDDALTTTVLAMNKPILLAPAMNEKMYSSEGVQKSIDILKKRKGYVVLDCAEGYLACGAIGKGRMQEIDVIYSETKKLFSSHSLKGKNILITAGPTQEKIDPVRYISNYSSGKMGYALAEECAQRGGNVVLISGPTLISPPPYTNIKCLYVESAEEMYNAVVSNIELYDIGILAAAVADFTPERVETNKIKHTSEGLCLHLKSTHDIAKEMGLQKKHNQILIGFALETENETQNAEKKLRNKNFDFIVLNSLRDKGAGFGGDTNKISILTKEGDKKEFVLKTKSEVARDILDFIESHNRTT